MTVPLVVALIFAPLAAVMAVLIVADEYEHHRLPRGQFVRLCSEVAIAVVVVFVLLSLVISLMTARW